MRSINIVLFALRALLVIAALAVEVRVKAAEVVQLREGPYPLQFPPGCLHSGDRLRCAVRTNGGEKLTLVTDSATVVLDQSTAIIRDGTDALKLVAGVVWIKANSTFTVRSEFGEARIHNGEMWVSRGLDYMRASAVTTAPVELWPRGSQEAVMIEPGMENRVYKVNARKDGIARTGIPTAIAFEAHLFRWARLYEGARQDFEKDVHRFHETWSQASLKAAGIHRALFERKVAMIESEKARKEAIERRIRRRDRGLLEHFRKRIFGE